MKVVGLMIARDEEVCVGLTLDTCHEWIDELCFIDNSSKDATVAIVKERCAKYGIPLYMDTAPLTNTIAQLRQKCLQLGVSRNPDWFFTVDADMVFNHEKIDIRELAASNQYDAYFFRTMNMHGDKDGGRCGGLNIPHMWLFRNMPDIWAGPNYVCKSGRTDPDTERFLGWNLTSVKEAHHFFWRSQIWYARAYNYQHGTNLSPEEFIKVYFGPSGVTENYILSFVYHTLVGLCAKVPYVASLYHMDEATFRDKYMDFPAEYHAWNCPFSLRFTTDGLLIGRAPDLMLPSYTPHRDIQQFKPHVQATFHDWFKNGVRNQIIYKVT